VPHYLIKHFRLLHIHQVSGSFNYFQARIFDAAMNRLGIDRFSDAVIAAR
jgi:hypothetical protein